MTMITPSYLGETIEYSSLHACRSTLEDPTCFSPGCVIQVHRSAAGYHEDVPHAPISESPGYVISQPDHSPLPQTGQARVAALFTTLPSPQAAPPFSGWPPSGAHSL